MSGMGDGPQLYVLTAGTLIRRGQLVGAEVFVGAPTSPHSSVR
jgi:hypothetical protein